MKLGKGVLGAGFSLVELLVACAITALVLGFVLRTFSAASLSWRHAEQRVDAYREARAAIDILTRDLQNVSPAFSSLSGDPISGNPPVLLLDYDPTTRAEDKVNEEVYAITMRPNAGASDLCTVGYRCVWDDAANCFTLRRRYKASNETFSTLVKAGAKKTLFAFSDIYFSPQDGSVEEDVAQDLWGLTIRPCINGAPASSYPRAGYSNQLPAWVEIHFNAMSSGAADKLKGRQISRSDWFSADSKVYTRAIAPNKETFSVRVRLNAGMAALTSTNGGTGVAQ
jgi:type II secretory pathway pseudopilin PulG